MGFIKKLVGGIGKAVGGIAKGVMKFAKSPLGKTLMGVGLGFLTGGTSLFASGGLFSSLGGVSGLLGKFGGFASKFLGPAQSFLSGSGLSSITGFLQNMKNPMDLLQMAKDIFSSKQKAPPTDATTQAAADSNLQQLFAHQHAQILLQQLKNIGQGGFNPFTATGA